MIQRYEMGDWGMTKSSAGTYVLYSDHLAVVAEKDNLLEMRQTIIDSQIEQIVHIFISLAVYFCDYINLTN